MKGLEKIAKVLEDNGVYADVYLYNDLPVVCVEINWGDWKHDHLRADWVMEEIGWSKFEVNVTEEDGSDTYSAIHYYMKTA